MPDTEWTLLSEGTATEWSLNTEHRSGGWGDAFGHFPWGQHEKYSDFSDKLADGVDPSWVKL